MMKTLYGNDLQSADIVWCGIGIRGIRGIIPDFK
jgi:hypothetical protein